MRLKSCKKEDGSSLIVCRIKYIGYFAKAFDMFSFGLVWPACFRAFLYILCISFVAVFYESLIKKKGGWKKFGFAVECSIC